MAKAEERAFEAYPVKMVNGPIGYEESVFDFNALCRHIFQEGYEQAQKDLGWISVKDRLPDIDEEVLVLVEPLKVYSSPMKLCFGHRPNPDGFDAKSTLTGKMKHYTPETYDGWNIPGVKYWMPCPKLPEDAR